MLRGSFISLYTQQVLDTSVQDSSNRSRRDLPDAVASGYIIFLEITIRETLIKAFPSPDLRCEAAISLANPCDPPEASKEMLIKSSFPQNPPADRTDLQRKLLLRSANPAWETL